MDVGLTSDQELFVQTSERFMETTWPLTAVRDRLTEHGDAGADYWRKAAELGWFAMLVPEQDGGGSVSGNGVHDAALVAYARGQLQQPGPFAGTNVVASTLARAGTSAQRAEVLPALVAGRSAATWAAAGSAADPSPDLGVEYRSQGGGFVLSGSKTLVHDADHCEWVLVAAAGPDGGAQFLVPRDAPGMAVRPLDGLDLTRRFCRVDFADVALEGSALVGEPGASADLVEHQLQLACVLTVAESVGAMRHDLEQAVQYAKDRVAFGRPIGSFQAVKHLLADSSFLVEMSTAVADAAARSVGAGEPGAGQVASMAKAFVGDCGVDLAQNCFQVFGGIGYTWEHDQHLYLRRLTTDAALYGDPAWHRERVCRLGGL